MLSFSLQHSLSDIIGIPPQGSEIPGPINNSKSDTDFILMNPKNCFCCSISKDGYSIIYQRLDSQIVFYQFTFYPPISRKLYEGNFETNDSIIEAFLSSNNRLFSFTTSLGQTIVVDLMGNSASTSSTSYSFQNIQHFIPILSTSHHTFYIFEKSQTLYFTSITYGLTMSNDLLLKNNTMIKKHVLWWAIDFQTRHIAVLTSKRSLHIYYFNGKASEVFTSSFSTFIPTNFFVTTKSTFVICSIEPNQVSFYTSANDELYTYKFSKKFSFSDLNTICFDSLILISISHVELLLFDAESSNISIINHHDLLDFTTPPTLISCSSSWSLYFDIDSLAFYRLDINFQMLTKLLPKYNLLIAHLIGGHPPFNAGSENIILTALASLNNFDFYSFLLEYIISATYSNVKLKAPALYLKYIPHTIKQYPQYNQQQNQEQDSNQNQIFQNCDYSKYIELKNELKQLIVPMYSQNQFQKWIELDNTYSPCGFWLPSTVLLSLYLIIHSKQPKNKLPFPLNEFDTFYPITFYSPTFEEKKQMKNLSFKSIRSFVDNFMEASIEISDGLVIPTDHASQLSLLLTHYVISKKFHLPYHIEKLRAIQKLAITYYTKTQCFILAKLGLFQFFDILNFEKEQLDNELILWMNSSNYSNNISPQLIEKKVQNWPIKYYYDTKLENVDETKENIFRPYVIYEKGTTDLSENDSNYIKMLQNEQNYSYDNLLSIYSPE